MSISQFSFLASSLVFSLVDEGRRRMGERGCYDAPGTATHALICKPAKESPTAAPLLPANISGMDSTSHPLTFTIPLPHTPAVLHLPADNHVVNLSPLFGRNSSSGLGLRQIMNH